MARHVDYYFTLHSPWSYLGHARFIEVVKKHALSLTYRPVPLARLFPETGGLPLAKRHRTRQDYRILELQRWRATLGLPLQLHPKFIPFEPGLADRVIIALQSLGADVEAFLPSAYDGVFASDQNLADEATLSALLTRAGLDAAPILNEAKSEKAQAQYDANFTSAMSAGVFGAPSYVLDGELFWGQDRVAFLDEALTSGRKPYRADA